jgi:hypothetical protein
VRFVPTTNVRSKRLPGHPRWLPVSWPQWLPGLAPRLSVPRCGDDRFIGSRANVQYNYKTTDKETVFISVGSIANGQVKEMIASDIMTVKGYKSGDAYTFAEAELVDWLISKADGSEEGNIVGKYLDTLR